MSYRYWINKQGGDVVVMTESAIVLADADAEVLNTVEAGLAAGHPVVEVLGSEATSIPYTALQSVTRKQPPGTASGWPGTILSSTATSAPPPTAC